MKSIDWPSLDRKIGELADNIRSSDQHFDAVVGIVRGGVIPARLLVTRLAISSMYCLNVRKLDGERRVVTTIDDDLLGQSLLLVEDVLESGRSLQVAKEYLETQKGASVATAALYYTIESEVTPQFSLGQINKVPYFPWE